jgi:GrpB-like predicted nucleotidyltransferase (UPF0157 family)
MLYLSKFSGTLLSLKMINLIEPHNANWKTEFTNLKEVLSKKLDVYNPDVQHIGSTAIPGLFAKPVLDIDIIIANKANLKGVSEILEKAGYKNKGEQGIAGRFAFRQSSARTPNMENLRTWQEHHLYVCYSDSLALKNHLAFRDALLNDIRLVKEYSDLKITLTKENGITREMYSKLKTDFILSVLTKNGFDEKAIHEIKMANI